uniref:Erythronate-4-phosphate dehydrogenase family protein n=1 Tax=Kalanchoe fedtschenkoi TaxID=63787 RepID=A0A7N0UPP4_KALFE
MMVGLSYDVSKKEEPATNGLQIIRHPSYYTPRKLSTAWLDLRVFYVRVSNFVVDDSTPEFLTLNLIPFSPNTLLEVNGSRCGLHSDGVLSLLRRDRMDKKCEEATFVGTDSIRLTCKVKFEVLDKAKLIVSGVLEMASSNGSTVRESTQISEQWSMNCESQIAAGTSFLKGKQIMGHEIFSPTIEVYLAGCFNGTPIILTKSIQLSNLKKQNKLRALDAIPEDETSEYKSNATSGEDLQVSEYHNYKLESEEEHRDPYWRGEYIESEDGELSWFNAGVRVGVGIGLGVCLGVGIGVGLMVRTYQATTRKFRGRLL